MASGAGGSTKRASRTRCPCPGGAELTALQARELYVRVVSRFAATYRPPFLFLGNESDAYFAADPADYARWIDAYEEAYAAVKAASPETLVGRLFGTISLRDEDGEERPVYDAWAAR